MARVQHVTHRGISPRLKEQNQILTFLMLPKMPLCFSSKAFFFSLTFVAITFVFLLYLRRTWVFAIQSEGDGSQKSQTKWFGAIWVALRLIPLSPALVDLDFSQRFFLCRRSLGRFSVHFIVQAGAAVSAVTTLDLQCFGVPSVTCSFLFTPLYSKLHKENIHKSPSFITTVRI